MGIGLDRADCLQTGEKPRHTRPGLAELGEFRGDQKATEWLGREMAQNLQTDLGVQRAATGALQEAGEGTWWVI